MNTKLNAKLNTPTPRTDAAVELTFAAGHNTVCPNFARTLERELHESRNAERLARVQLGNERARLDWVLHNCKINIDDNIDIFSIHDREDLSVAMKEGAKCTRKLRRWSHYS